MEMPNMHAPRTAAILLTAWLATLCPVAMAVDPLLHDTATLWVDSAGPVAATMPAPPNVAEAVELSDIEELGATPAAAAAPGDLWQRMRNGFAIPDLTGRIVDQRARWYAERPELLQ